jgi:regulator of replication initiation timing
MKDVSASISVAVITRPPEIIAVLKIPCSSGSEVFVVFDSHPREIHPDGAGLIFNTSADAVADYLYDLFKFDERLLQDESLQWQAQLLANFSAHIFTANKSFDNYSASDAVLDASLAVLSSKAQVVHLASDNSATKAENQHLRDRIEALEVENAELREEIRRLRKQYSSNLHYNSNRGWSNGMLSSLPMFNPNIRG